MDENTEIILKLAALGWDGKEDKEEFLFGLCRMEWLWRKNGTSLQITYTINRTHHAHWITFSEDKRKKINPILYCLKFFRTVEGKPVGPDPDFLTTEEQEWT